MTRDDIAKIMKISGESEEAVQRAAADQARIEEIKQRHPDFSETEVVLSILFADAIVLE